MKHSSSFLFVLVLAVPSLAAAQEAAPTSAPADDGQPPPADAPPPSEEAANEGPMMNLSVAPPPPVIGRKAYVHEGFYLRADVGAGVMWSNLSTGGASFSGSGFALGADLLVGGSLAPGLAIGGGLLTNIGPAISFGNASQTQVQFLVGPFIDAFPNDKKGFHLGAEAGFAGTTLDGSPSSAFGGGAAAWVGYDAWVAPEWSAGGLVRGSGAYMVGDNVDASAFQLMFLITFLNH